MHSRDMLHSAYERGFSPKYVLFDCAYTDIKTLKLLRFYGWKFIAGVRANRKVSLVLHEYKDVADVATKEGVTCWLKIFGPVKVFKLVLPKTGDIDYLVTNDLTISTSVVRSANNRRWRIEEFHRGGKQMTGLEYCQARSQRAQRNHILCSYLAFLALEKWRLETGVSWLHAKVQIVSKAIAQYLAQPFIPLSKASP